LQVFSPIRNERLLMAPLNGDLLFRWFVGLEIDDARRPFGPAILRSLTVTVL